jgi:hypothetical protein
MSNSGIHWTEPKDVCFDDLQALQSLAANRPHTRYNGYFFCKTPAMNAVLVYGDMVLIFPWDSTTGVLSGLLPAEEPRTRTGHDPKYDPFSQLYVEELRIHWPHCIGLPVWIVACCLLFFRVTRRRHGCAESLRRSD